MAADVHKARFTAGVVGCLATGIACADPDWQSATTAAGLTVYPDHASSNTYYYQPPQFDVLLRDGQPQVYYRLYRYLGTTETGDSDAFDVAGVLSIDVVAQGIETQAAAALAELRRRRPNAALRSVPISSFTGTLDYVGIDDDEETVTGSVDVQGVSDLGPDDTATGGGLWTRRRFTVAFEPLTAQLFWQNFEAGRLQLSLSYVYRSPGRVRNTDGQWQEDLRTFANSTPIPVAMAELPDHFEAVETWQLARKRRTDVVVMCYDFFQDGAEELYRINVELRFRTARDQDYVERVRFDGPDDETERTVSFRLARSLDEPYYYRVTRLYKSVPPVTGDWIENQGLLLDVTDYAL